MTGRKEEGETLSRKMQILVKGTHRDVVVVGKGRCSLKSLLLEFPARRERRYDDDERAPSVETYVRACGGVVWEEGWTKRRGSFCIPSQLARKKKEIKECPPRKKKNILNDRQI